MQSEYFVIGKGNIEKNNKKFKLIIKLKQKLFLFDLIILNGDT